MIQRDYIQRMIEALSKVLGKLMGLKPPEGLDLIEETRRDHLNIKGEWLDSLSESGLLEALQKEKGLHVGQIEFLAELLAREGELLLEMEAIEKGKSKLSKAMLLFDYVEAELQLFSFERETLLAKIRRMLS